MTFVKNELWNTKAVAFATRARQELWGKHNGDIMAYLFKRGLSNTTAEKLLLGWNRRGKVRSAESWGLDPEKTTVSEGKLFFPEGIVVPFVVDKELRKITIVETAKVSSGDRNHVISGSQPVSMVYGNAVPGIMTYVTENLLDGLYVSQELGGAEKTCLIIPHDLSMPPDDFASAEMKCSDSITFLTRHDSRSCEKWIAAYPHAECKAYNDLDELGAILGK